MRTQSDRLTGLLLLLTAACCAAVADEPPGHLSPAAILELAERSETSYSVAVLDELEGVDPERLGEQLWPSGGGEIEFPTTRIGQAGARSLHAYPLDDGCMSLLNEAAPLFDEERFDRALPIYERAVERHPDCYVARSHLGDCHFFSGRFRQALRHYNDALALNPDDFRTHFYRGNALYRLGRVGDARRAYREALALRPHRESLVAVLGARAEELGIAFAPERFDPRAFAREAGDTIEVFFDADKPYWLTYGLCKAIWLGEPEHREARTGETEHGWTSTEESQCLLSLAENYYLLRQGDAVAEDPVLERLLAVIEDGKLTGFVLYEIGARRSPHFTLLLPESAFEEMTGYLDAFVVPLLEQQS